MPKQLPNGNETVNEIVIIQHSIIIIITEYSPAIPMAVCGWRV